MDYYFPSINIEQYDWIRNPFIDISIYDAGFSLIEEEELATISTDRGLKIKHKETSIEQFWISIKEQYPSIARKALTVLLQFSTSYLCEQNLPNIHKIAKSHQSHVSH